MGFTQLSCGDFIGVLASKSPTPGGGGASALVGAIGMALGNMVGSLTLGKKKYADVQDTVIGLKEKADALQAELLNLVERDAEVFEPLSRAYGIPKDDPQRPAAMEKCLRDCAEVPFGIMECCCSAIDLHKEFARVGAAIAISDVGCGVACCKAALMAASLNVFINTKSMADRAHAEVLNRSAEELLVKYTALADEIYGDVRVRFA